MHAQTEASGKPSNVVERIVQGRLEKFFVETCLIDQPFVKDPNRTVAEVVKEAISTIGENIVVRRFSRYQVGESSNTP